MRFQSHCGTLIYPLCVSHVFLKYGYREMPSPGMKNDKTQTLAVTWRPRSGIKKRHEMLLKAWLHKHAEQWEFWEETVEDADDSRHLHGRVLLKSLTRMDAVKRSLITGLEACLDEKRALQKGIKWLYDSWEYAGKDNCIWDRNITDEDEWEEFYADPDLKTEKNKNAEIWFRIKHLEAQLSTITTPAEVKRVAVPVIVRGDLKMPGTIAALDNKCAIIALFWNAKQALQDETGMSD